VRQSIEHFPGGVEAAAVQFVYCRWGHWILPPLLQAPHQHRSWARLLLQEPLLGGGHATRPLHGQHVRHQGAATAELQRAPAARTQRRLRHRRARCPTRQKAAPAATWVWSPSRRQLHTKMQNENEKEPTNLNKNQERGDMN